MQREGRSKTTESVSCTNGGAIRSFVRVHARIRPLRRWRYDKSMKSERFVKIALFVLTLTVLLLIYLVIKKPTVTNAVHLIV